MKILSLVFLSMFLLVNVSYAKTLVKYHKNTGDIIQTNTVDEMPSQEILIDRFKSENTDVILVDIPVDICTQRVDLNKKSIINIPQKELDDTKKIQEEKQTEEKIIQDKIRKQAIDALTAEGVVLKHQKKEK
jgi:predicted kinase